MLEIYTDGACSSKNNAGGWALAFNHNGKLYTAKGGEKDTTNNRMEMTAIYKALHTAFHVFKEKEVIIYTDSAYCMNCFEKQWYISWRNNGWKNSKKEPVKNQDLWVQLLAAYEDWGMKVTFVKVKGHSGNQLNTLVDKLAVEARKEI